MRMVQVIDGEIIQYYLPRTGYLKDGSSVSGYDILMESDPELAKEESWLPLEETVPEYDDKTHFIVDEIYTILEDKVVKEYVIEPYPEKEPSELDLMGQEIANIKLKMIMGGM